MNWWTNKFSQLQNMFSFGNIKENNESKVDLDTLKMGELKTIAKNRNLKGYTKLRKAALIEMLENTAP